MAAGNKTHFTLALDNILKIHADGDQVVVGMGPELNILMPLHRFATVGPLEVQLAMMKFDIRPEKCLGQINNF